MLCLVVVELGVHGELQSTAAVPSKCLDELAPIQECTCTCFPPYVAGIASSPPPTPTVVFVSGFCSKMHVYITHMYRCMHSPSNLGCSQSALVSGRASQKGKRPYSVSNQKDINHIFSKLLKYINYMRGAN